MALKGIDISNYQSGLDAGKISADFIICKATEGTTYVNPVCDKHYQQAKKAGKLRGVYHFARNDVNSAEAEAQFFYNNVKGYVNDGDCLFILDWEKNVADVAWAKRFLDKFKALSGKKALIYMSESVVNRYNWQSVVDGDYGLWVAKYRDDQIDINYNMANAGSRPSVKYWPFYVMWQWTSSGRLTGYEGNLDCNEFYGDRNTWLAYAGAKTEQPNKVKVENMVAPRVLEAKGNLRKFNFDTRKVEGDVMLPTGDARLFLKKADVDGVTYLVTEHDSDGNFRLGFKLSDLKEVSEYYTNVALELRKLKGGK